MCNEERWRERERDPLWLRVSHIFGHTHFPCRSWMVEAKTKLSGSQDPWRGLFLALRRLSDPQMLHWPMAQAPNLLLPGLFQKHCNCLHTCIGRAWQVWQQWHISQVVDPMDRYNKAVCVGIAWEDCVVIQFNAHPRMYHAACSLRASIAHFAKAPQSVGKVLGLLWKVAQRNIWFHW